MEDKLKKYSIYGKLDELEKELQGNDFIRIHQSYLVNMKHIEKVSRYEALLNNGIKLEIPKARYKFCLLYTSPSPRDISGSRMPSSA